MTRSSDLHERARGRMPGGVNSPVRAFGSVEGDPIYVASAKGAYVTDADGKQYIDCVASWGPMILGHAHPKVLEAVTSTAARGTSFGAPTELELELANLICECVPSVEMLRLTSSGTEAAMSALRLARAYTGRDRVIKFEGCYHGHADSFLVKAGSGAAELGQPSSPGVPAALAELTLNARYNDLDSVSALFEQFPGEIACIAVEPVAGNMGVVLPAEGFLEGLRALADEHGAVLLFDEVISGFRLGLGGAQEYFGVMPDLTAMGKILGGGLPLGAFGASAEIMQELSPVGPVYQAGTLSGNPVAVAAGLATVRELRDTNPYAELQTKADRLYAGLTAAAARVSTPTTINRIASMGTVFVGNPGPVSNFDDASKTDGELYGRYHRAMLNRGVYMAPALYEASFVSTAHSDADIDAIIAAAGEALAEVVS